MEEWDPTWTDKKDAGSLKKGDHVIMKGQFPCKVTGVNHAKPGKHGSAKAIIKAQNLFDGKTVEETFGTGDMIDVPIINRNEFLLLGIEDDNLSLLDDDGNQKDDVTFDEKRDAEVRKLIEDFLAEDKQVLVQITTVLGKDMVTAAREDKD